MVDTLAGELLAVRSPVGLEAAERMAADLHHAGRYRGASMVAARLAADPRAPVDVWSYNAACSVARAGHPDAAVRWLEAAVAAGWRDHERLLSDPDLAEVRLHPAFGSVRLRLAGAA